MNLIKSKQIESLEANKIIQSDDLRFISKADLDNVKKLQNVNIETLETVLGDTVSQVDTNKDKIADLENNSHTHDNKDVLSELSESQDGKLLYKGNVIEGGSGESGDVINNITINEMSNPLTTKPLDYGYFKLSNNVSNLSANTSIPFDVVAGGNMQLNNKGEILLKGGKTYKILAGAFITGSSDNTAIGLRVVNTETKEMLFGGCKVPSTHTSAYSGNDVMGIVTVDNDMYIGLQSAYDITFINHHYTNLVVEEVRDNIVNQYGGFEIEVLFDGEASSIGEYELTDSVENYNMLMINSFDDSEPISIVPVMSSNSQNGYVVSASSVYGDSGLHQPYTVFDGIIPSGGSETYGFATNNTVEGWLKIELPYKKVVECIDICPYIVTNAGIKDFSFEGSNDDSEWDTLFTGVANSWVSGQYQKFSIDNEKAYKYYRLSFTTNYGSNYTAIGELKLYECPKKIMKNNLLVSRCDLDKKILVGDTHIEMKDNSFQIEMFNTTPISKIIGIKGQIPSLLVGGKF